MATDGSPRRVKRSPALTAMDYWNAAFRGFVPGGWNSEPPEATDMGDVPPFSEDVEDYVLPDAPVKTEQDIAPMPVSIVSDLSHTLKRVERFATTFSANVVTTPTLLIPRNPFRAQTILTVTGVPIYLGHNESIGTGGFAMAVNTVLVLGTTRELFACTAPDASGPATVSVIMEYDKDTFTE